MEGLEFYTELVDRITGPAKLGARSLGGLGKQLKTVDDQLKHLNTTALKLRLKEAFGGGGAENRAALRGINAQRGALRELQRVGQGGGGSRGGLFSSGGLGRAALVAGAVVAVGAAALSAAAGLARMGLDGMAAVMRIGAHAENTRIVIAGMLQAGGATTVWGQSMRVAGRAMEQIRHDAARLPGEADDFITVFRAGLPKALAAGMRDPMQVAGFTNRFAALGNVLGRDSAEVGRDLNLMLSGRAGANVAMFSALQPHITAAARGMGLTVRNAKDFNKLRPAQWLALTQAALARFDPMIEAFKDTWETQESTFKSTGDELLRIGSAPLFERMKTTLKGVNEWLDHNKGLVQSLAILVGDTLGGAFDFIVGQLKGISPDDLMTGFREVLDIVKGLGGVFANVIWPVLKGLGGGAFKAIGSALGPLSTVLGMLSGSKVDAGPWETIGKALGYVAVAVGALGLALGAAGAAIFAVLGTIGSGFVELFSGQTWSELGAGLSDIGTRIVDGLWNGLTAAWAGLLARFRGLVDLLPAAVRRALGIASPSRVFMELGVHTAAGFERGISAGMPDVGSALEGMVAAPRVEAPRSGGGGTVHLEVNITIEGADRDAGDIAVEVENRLRAFIERTGLEPAV
jgi:hypothetical protein